MAVMMRSMLDVADNSGARKLQMILPLGGSTGLVAGLGDVITAAVKEASPDGTAKKGTVVKAVIVRTRKEHRRRDGTYIRFDQNAAVLINDHARAGRHARVRSGGPRAAREEVLEDCFAGAGSTVRQLQWPVAQLSVTLENGQPGNCQRREDRHAEECRYSSQRSGAGDYRRDKGKQGRVLRVMPGEGKVLVEHV